MDEQRAEKTRKQISSTCSPPSRNIPHLIASCSSHAQTERLSKDGWYSIDRDLDRWSCRRSRIASQSLLPRQPPMRSLRSCERAKGWRRMQSGLSIDSDLVVAEPLHPCSTWLTPLPVIPEDRMGSRQTGRWMLFRYRLRLGMQDSADATGLFGRGAMSLALREQ